MKIIGIGPGVYFGGKGGGAVLKHLWFRLSYFDFFIAISTTTIFQYKI